MVLLFPPSPAIAPQRDKNKKQKTNVATCFMSFDFCFSFVFFRSVSHLWSSLMFFLSPQRNSPVSVEIARVIEIGVRDSQALDTEALCILGGEKVCAGVFPPPLLPSHGVHTE